MMMTAILENLLGSYHATKIRDIRSPHKQKLKVIGNLAKNEKKIIELES